MSDHGRRASQLLEALQGIGLVVLVTAGVWAIGALISLLVAWAY